MLPLEEETSPRLRLIRPSYLLRVSPLLNSLLPDAGGERVAVEELRVGDGRCRWRNLLGALRRHLLVGNGLDELSDPKPAGIAGGTVGRQDVICAYGFVGVGDRRVLPQEERAIVREAIEKPVEVSGLDLKVLGCHLV